MMSKIRRMTKQISKKLLKEIKKERNDENLFTREDAERLDRALGIAPQRTDADTKALP